MVRRRAHRAGFTLVELAVVLLIIALASAVAIPSFVKARRQAQLDKRTRELVSMFLVAQSAAVTGRQLNGTVPGVVGQAQSAGVRFIDNTRYVVFVDNDNDPGAIEIIASVDLSGATGGGVGMATEDAGFQVELESVTVGGVTETPPAGIEFRFRNDATVVNQDAVAIQLVDVEMERRSTIQLSVAGQATGTKTTF